MFISRCRLFSLTLSILFVSLNFTWFNCHHRRRRLRRSDKSNTNNEWERTKWIVAFKRYRVYLILSLRYYTLCRYWVFQHVSRLSNDPNIDFFISLLLFACAPLLSCMCVRVCRIKTNAKCIGMHSSLSGVDNFFHAYIRNRKRRENRKAKLRPKYECN